jgi:hypothetical protein
MLISPQTHNATSLEYRYGYDSRPLPSRTLPSHNGGPQQSFAPSRRELPPQDMALPSIELATDLANESPSRTNPYIPLRYSQVMYEEIEPERRLVPAHTNITYVNDWEDNQPKRRRLVLADDRAHIPASPSTSEGYVHLVPKSRAEQPAVMAPSLRRVTEIKGDKERNDVPTVIDHRLGYPSYTERIADTRDQSGFPLINEFGRPNDTDRESRIIIDDFPPQVRMVRRAPEPSQSYSGELHNSEPQLHNSQRVGDQHYFETSGPTQSMQAAFHENSRLIDPNQSVQPVIYARAPPSYQQRVAQGSSTSLSTFPSHPHSREMNSGLVSYPIISRPRHDQESRFSSNRNEPVLVGTKSSHQFPQERFAADNFERVV